MRKKHPLVEEIFIIDLISQTQNFIESFNAFFRSLIYRIEKEFDPVPQIVLGSHVHQGIVITAFMLFEEIREIQ